MFGHFKLYHAAVIVAFVGAWIPTILGIIDYLKLYGYVVPEILIHLGIVFICLAFTQRIIKESCIRLTLRALGFRATDLRFYGFAIVITAIVWVADLWFQTNILMVDVNAKGQDLERDLVRQGLVGSSFAICLLAPISEEILFRGIILKSLLSALKPFWVILISSLLFSFIHFSPADALTLFIAAVIYGLLTLKSKSILPALISHSANNTLTLCYLLTYR